MEQLLKDLREMSALEGNASWEKAKEIASKYTSDKDRLYIKQYMDAELDEIGAELDMVNKMLKKMLNEVLEAKG